MKEWKEYKLGKLVRTNRKSISSAYEFDEIQYLDTGSITEGKIESFQKFKLSDAPSRAKRLVEQDDIIYSTVRPIQRHYGFITNPQENLVVSTGFATITTNKKLLRPKYLYYLLTNNETVEYLDVIAEASTSAYPSLKPSDIENLEILLPPLPTQTAIASILSSLDDKIDLLHRQNATLEKMAETLFRQWFVEEAKEEWEMGKLGDVLEFNYGKNLPQKERAGSGYPVYGSSGITGYHTEFLVKGPGIITGRKGTLGKIMYSFESFHPIDTTFYITNDRKGSKMLFDYFLLKTLNLGEMNSDSAVPGLNRQNAESIETPIPPDNLIQEFEAMIGASFKKIQINRTQIHTLTALRDTLLPKLMSGEVRVEI